MPDECERIEQLAAEGRISEADAVQFQEALAAAEKRGAAQGGLVLSWVLLALDVALLLGLAAVLPAKLPGFVKMFMEMELMDGLPPLTQVLLFLPGWGYALLFLSLAAVMVVKELLVKRKAVTLVMNAVVLVGLLLFKLFVVWALFLPMVSMMRQLSEST